MNQATCNGASHGRRRVKQICLLLFSLALVAFSLLACCHVPAPGACPAGQVALVPSSLYAVYLGGAKPQVEDTRTVKNRCIVPIWQSPVTQSSGAGSPPLQCPAGTKPLLPHVTWAEYFGGPTGDDSLQREDVRGVVDRCIIETPEPSSFETCPPGYREKLVQGIKYCVPT